MKKGHPFRFSFNPATTKVRVDKGSKIVIDGIEEKVHSIVYVENESPYVHIIGYLAKREESE